MQVKIHKNIHCWGLSIWGLVWICASIYFSQCSPMVHTNLRRQREHIQCMYFTSMNILLYLLTRLLIYLFIYIVIYLFINLSLYLSNYSSLFLSVSLSSPLSPSTHTSRIQYGYCKRVSLTAVSEISPSKTCSVIRGK